MAIHRIRQLKVIADVERTGKDNSQSYKSDKMIDACMAVQFHQALQKIYGFTRRPQNRKDNPPKSNRNDIGLLENIDFIDDWL